jgi:hypothetical protein
MYRKFSKLLIVGNPQPIILHIPNKNNGIIAFHALVVKEKEAEKLWSQPSPPQAFICPKDATPSFQYSNIPTFQLRSEAELSSNF